MTGVRALAAVLAAAGAASAQVVVARLPPSAPSVSAPAPTTPVLAAPAVSMIALAPAALGAPIPHAAPDTGLAPGTSSGKPDPLLTPALIEAGGAWDGAPVRPRGEFGTLQEYARPWRTDAQLAKLAAAPREPGGSFRFAVIGDAEPGRFWIARRLFSKPGVFWRLLARADRSGSDFIFQLGDMVSRGTSARFLAFIRGLFASGTRTPYLTALGNHDRHRPHGVTNDRMYRAAFGSPDYSFTRGGWRFVVVDSSVGRVTEAQLKWLEGELDAAVPAVVFTHIPPAQLSEWTDWGRLKGAGGFKEGGEEFMRLMSAKKVARVYMGHIHGLGVLERGGVRYVLTGGGGSPLFPGPVKRRLHHWLSVEVLPEGLSETVHADDGSSFPLGPTAPPRGSQ